MPEEKRLKEQLEQTVKGKIFRCGCGRDDCLQAYFFSGQLTSEGFIAYALGDPENIPERMLPYSVKVNSLEANRRKYRQISPKDLTQDEAQLLAEAERITGVEALAYAQTPRQPSRTNPSDARSGVDAKAAERLRRSISGADD